VEVEDDAEPWWWTEDDDGPRGLASTRQAQQLLAGIGFPIRADGQAGPSTRQAVTWFQEAWTYSNLTANGKWGASTEAAIRACLKGNGRVSPHFTMRAFACRHCRWPRAHRDLTRALEKYRAAYFSKGGLALVSAYRCTIHNTAIGGARGSQHLTGRAVDVPPRGDGGRLITVDMAARLHLFSGLEYQPKTASGRGCTHVDVRAGGSRTRPAVFAWG
jgi:zinc D-Ala-D-Ala carboxypeptidase